MYGLRHCCLSVGFLSQPSDNTDWVLKGRLRISRTLSVWHLLVDYPLHSLAQRPHHPEPGLPSLAHSVSSLPRSTAGKLICSVHLRDAFVVWNPLLHKLYPLLPCFQIEVIFSPYFSILPGSLFTFFFIQQSLSLSHNFCHSSFLEIPHLHRFIFSYWWSWSL